MFTLAKNVHVKYAFCIQELDLSLSENVNSFRKKNPKFNLAPN